MHILPIASGKGGVGKSLVSANLAIALAQSGKRVALADLDLGGSNLHLILGIPAAKIGVGDFLTNASISIDDIMVATRYNGLLFIPGDSEIPGLANMQIGHKKRLLKALTNLNVDYLILDLGAGTTYNTVDFFLASGHGLIVTTPAPTAMVNAYLFLKNCIYRIIYTNVKRNTPAGEFLKDLQNQDNIYQKMYIPNIIQKIKELDPKAYAKIAESVSKFKPRLIFNMLEDPKDATKVNKLRRSCQQYLDIDLEHLGIIYRDDLQDIALQSRLPIISYKPQSVLSQAIYRIGDKLIQNDVYDDEPITDMDESFQEAAIEAQVDFQSKMDYVEELLNSGSLTTGDLIETIRSQQMEINQLRKENQLYKHKIVKAMNKGFTG